MSRSRFDTSDTATVSDTTSGSSASTVSSERPLQSPVWKQFRREKGKAVCLLCNKTMAYNGGTTSNLKQHLHRLHKPNIQVEADDEDEVQSTTRQLSITQFTSKERSSVMWTVDMQKEVTRLLAKWTWKDMRPISIVRDDGLKELLNFLAPKYKPPSTTYVTSLIRKDYLDGKAAITAKLRGNTVALTTDIWTSKATQSFATTTAHFIDKNWNLITCVLETTHFPGHRTGVSISEKLQETLTSYNVDVDKVSAVVHDEASNAVLAGECIIILLQCIYHIVVCTLYGGILVLNIEIIIDPFKNSDFTFTVF